MERPHVHDWRVEVVFRSDQLDEAGCVIDFCDIDSKIEGAIAGLAGKCVHDTADFINQSPSAENIARHIFKTVSSEINHPEAKLHKVTVWEDADHFASYRG